jgi:pyruvate-formate lyase-activating enzyme
MFSGFLLPPGRRRNPENNREFAELVQESLAESKTAHFSPFFTFFQLRSTGYAPSKTQKLTKNHPVFANGRES